MKLYLLSFMAICVACIPAERTVNYTKGHPFWKHDYKNGELMATYYSECGNFQFDKYFGVLDTLRGQKVSLAENRVGVYSWQAETSNGGNITFFDYSRRHIRGYELIDFPAIRNEWRTQ